MALRKKTMRRSLPEMGLNITSLIDVLTVLIFFLIRTMTVSSETFNIPKDLKLPVSVSDTEVQEATVVSVSKKDISVNHEVLLNLDTHKRYPASELGEDGKTLVKLKKRLDQERTKKKQIFVSKGGGEIVPPGRILIQADKDLSFETIKYVLHTVTSAGYTDFQFLAEPKEN